MKSRAPWILFSCCLAVYSLTSLGGILSPDSEVVFRSAENLAGHGSFSVTRRLEGWTAFGVARARDNKYYPVFGPGASAALVPFITIVNGLRFPERFQQLPFLALPDVEMQRVESYAPDVLRARALRFFCSFYNVLVTALTVVLLWKILVLMGFTAGCSSFVSVLYAFATLAWPYAGTYFSEPLATLLVLASFWYLLKNSPFLSGLFMGLGILVHISAILFAPFFFFYAIAVNYQANRGLQIRDAFRFCVGLGLCLAALGYYDFYRFGSIFETGRTADPFNSEKLGYGRFLVSAQPFYGLLFGGGKGLLVYCPIVLCGILAWPGFHARNRALSWMLVSAILFRWAFMAMRSDWHAGFCLGPRYLLMIVPFLMLPIAGWMERRVGNPVHHTLMLCASAFAVCQQLYFALGEVITYFFALKLMFQQKIISFASADQFYMNWKYSPALFLHHGFPGPFVLRPWFVEYPLRSGFCLPRSRASW